MATISKKLINYGPPNEWSGSIAGFLGKEGRRELTLEWKGLSSEEKKEAKRKFHAKFYKSAGMDFTKQDRPKKVKDIYKALKRDHPTMPAEMKARIASRQGKPGKQRQGPPYKAPLTNSYKSASEKSNDTNLEVALGGAGIGSLVAEHLRRGRQTELASRALRAKEYARGVKSIGKSLLDTGVFSDIIRSDHFERARKAEQVAEKALKMKSGLEASRWGIRGIGAALGVPTLFVARHLKDYLMSKKSSALARIKTLAPKLRKAVEARRSKVLKAMKSVAK